MNLRSLEEGSFVYKNREPLTVQTLESCVVHWPRVVRISKVVSTVITKVWQIISLGILSCLHLM